MTHAENRRSAARKIRGVAYALTKKDMGTLPMKSWVALGAGEPWPAKASVNHKAEIYAFKAGNFSGGESLVIRGRIVYQDVFENYFFSEFAFFIEADGPSGTRFLRPHGVIPAYKSLTPETANNYLGRSVINGDVSQ